MLPPHLSPRIAVLPGIAMNGNPLASRLTRLMILGNLAGALLTFVYFSVIDRSANVSAPSTSAGVWNSA